MQFVQQEYDRPCAARREYYAEADRLAQECHYLQQEVEEGRKRLDLLTMGYDMLARNVDEQYQDVDRLRTDHALRDQEINRLRSSPFCQH